MDISGISLVNRIDEVISELGLTRKDFATKIDVNPTTMATWKTRNIFPPVDTLSKIADNLEVSLEWLITGSLGYGVDKKSFGDYSREAVRERIYKTLIQEDELPSEEVLAIIHSKNALAFPISYQALKNWAKGRISLDMYFFQQISYKINANLHYLLTGDEYKLPKDFDPILFKAARENTDSLLCIYELNSEKKKIINDIVNKFRDLEWFEKTPKGGSSLDFLASLAPSK